MDKENSIWRRVVSQRCRSFLSQSLNVRDFAGHLMAHGELITYAEYQLIKGKELKAEQFIELLDILVTKERFWEPLLQFLEESKQGHIRNQLEAEYRNLGGEEAEPRSMPHLTPDFASSTHGGADHYEALRVGWIRIGKIDYNPEDVLGEGSDETIVYKGRFDGKHVAVKKVRTDLTNSDREINLLRQSDAYPHPNVVKYLYVEKDAIHRFIALELCQKNLDNFVKSTTLESRTLARLLEQTVSGLCHLHGLGIVHRDIRPQNVLISEYSNGQIRALIADFGLSKNLAPGHLSMSKTRISGTIGWMAPELSDEQTKRLTPKVDIFSLGCVFYFVLTRGGHPFDDPNDDPDPHLRQAYIKRGKYSLDKLNSKEKSLARQLVKWLISNRPEERPSAEDVLKHPFFLSPEQLSSFQQSSGSFKKDEDSSQIRKQTEVHAATHNDILSTAQELRKRSFTKWMLKDYQGSLADLNDSLRLEPNNADALSSRGETKRLLKDYQGSLADLDESLRLEPNNADALVNAVRPSGC